MDKMMIKVNLIVLNLLLCSTWATAKMPGLSPAEQEQYLIDQVHLGEASDKSDLIDQAIDRLAMLDSQTPKVLAVRIEQALRQNDLAKAQQLWQLIPTDSQFYQLAQINIQLAQPEGRQQLQQARLLARSGQNEKAKEVYDRLFQGQPPSFTLAYDYALLLSHLPNYQSQATAQLKQLASDYPGSTNLSLTLMPLLLASQQQTDAYALLQRAAANTTLYDELAAMWFEYLKTLPINGETIRLLRRFLSDLADNPLQGSVANLLTEYQVKWADPAYHARISGLDKLAHGDTSNAQSDILLALKTSPNDAELIGALGTIAMRNGQRQQAIALFEQALSLETDHSRNDKWLSLIESNRYWLLIAQGEQALEQHQLQRADQYYQEALNLNQQDSSALIGLGNVAMAENNPQRAEHYYQRALQLDPNDSWLVYRLAKQWYVQHRQQEGDRLFNDLLRRQNNSAESIYAYALYLSATQRDSAAIAALHRLPEPQWDQSMQDLNNRLIATMEIDHATSLWDAGQQQQAIDYLSQQPPNGVFEIQIADWLSQRGEQATALRAYQQILQEQPQNSDVQLSIVELLIQMQQQQRANWVLQDFKVSAEQLSFNQQRRLANIYSALGEQAKAQALFTSLVAQAEGGSASPESILLLRDAARFATATTQYEHAFDYYQQVLQLADMTNKQPVDRQSLSAFTQPQASDDWLKRSIRGDIDQLYRQQMTTVTLSHDQAQSSGTPGYSDFKLATSMLQIETPLADGRAFLRMDQVEIDAGQFSSNDDGIYTAADFASCILGCTGEGSSKQSGSSFALGWQNSTWQIDIGTTPLGFAVQDWVGGITYASQWREIGWSLTASKRPLTNSLLSFAGATDPNLHSKWGGVRARGMTLSSSYDRGEAHGVWNNFDWHTLEGKNVPTNQRVRLMTGYYYKLINEDDRRLSIGLNNMLWHYQRDLSGYTYGQGGYYSPQSYLSFSLPVSYRQRSDNWSWQLGGALSWSASHVASSQRYPNGIPSLQQFCDQYQRCDISPQQYQDLLDNSTNQSSRSRGVGYTANLSLERRLSSHWVIGGGIDLQKAKDYTPSHAFIYLRYTLQPWGGALNLSVNPLTPYAEFK